MFAYLQKIGKALMVPVAVLPAASILMGIGYWIDPTGWGANSQLAAFLISSGSALIDNMGILFAIGVGFGLSKDKHGSAALTALVGWLIIQKLLAPETMAMLTGHEVDAISPAFGKVNNQFIGILTGVIAAEVYNRTYKVQLSPTLSFFSGRRLSAIVMAVVTIIASFILAFIWPVVYGGLVNFGEGILSLNAVGAGIYGFANRMLIPIGLHHALNSVFWFDVAGINDINNFLAGAVDLNTDTYTVGMYQAGFFPIMMFGLPAGAFAILKNAKHENKDKVKAIMLAGAFASFFTGVTEPLEFSFMFVAWPLYVMHAIFTGISVFIAAKMQWIAGFGFSAGLVDYVLSLRNPAATNAVMLLVQGIGFAALYYFSFDFMINKFNLLTPGRGDDMEETSTSSVDGDEKYAVMADKIIEIIGEDNIVETDNCISRLRLVVKDSSIIDDNSLKSLGVLGHLKPSKTTIQIIIGADVQFVADIMKEKLNR